MTYVMFDVYLAVWNICFCTVKFNKQHMGCEAQWLENASRTVVSPGDLDQ